MKEKNLRLELEERLDYDEREGKKSMVVRAAYVVTKSDELEGMQIERFESFGVAWFLWTKEFDCERIYRILRPDVFTVPDAVRLLDSGAAEISNVLLDYNNIVIDGTVWAGVDPFERFIPF